MNSIDSVIIKKKTTLPEINIIANIHNFSMLQQNREGRIELISKFENLRCAQHGAEAIAFINLDAIGEPVFCSRCVCREKKIQIAQLEEILQSYQQVPEIEGTWVEFNRVVKIIQEEVERSLAAIQSLGKKVQLKLDKFCQGLKEKVNPIKGVVDFLSKENSLTLQKVRQLTPKILSILENDQDGWKLRPQHQSLRAMQQKLKILKSLEFVNFNIQKGEIEDR